MSQEVPYWHLKMHFWQINLKIRRICCTNVEIMWGTVYWLRLTAIKSSFCVQNERFINGKHQILDYRPKVSPLLCENSLEIWLSTREKGGGAFIPAGTFFLQNMVCREAHITGNNYNRLKVADLNAGFNAGSRDTVWVHKQNWTDLAQVQVSSTSGDELKRSGTPAASHHDCSAKRKCQTWSQTSKNLNVESKCHLVH